MAAADKARFQREMDEYTTEKKALQMYRTKQLQDTAMELLDATLKAEKALDDAKNNTGGKKKKDPEAPKRSLSAYMVRTTCYETFPQ